MGIFDRFTGSDDDEADSEQLADGKLNPRGQHRRDEFLISNRKSTFDQANRVETEALTAPEKTDEYWQKYYRGFALTRAPLQIFSDAVTEPGYQINVTKNGEVDEEMEEALNLWAENCVIHAGETRQDLSVLLNRAPAQRRGRGTALIEKVGYKEDPDALGALMYHDPSTFKIYMRDDQNILVHPDDNVDSNHPKTPDGKAAAYVQYDEDLNLSSSKDNDPISFVTDDIIKLTFDPDVGSPWGTSVFESMDERIESLKQKFNDRDTAIRMTGHPHRIYSSENWTQEEAQNYAEKHQKGEMSSWKTREDAEEDSLAGRTDFVSDTVDINVVNGNVADISDAVKDDIEFIFSEMPVSKLQIAYVDQINQFVAEPLMERDSRQEDDERQYLVRKIEPVFKEKADELAPGDSYDGNVDFRIEPDEETNPLLRDSFPTENVQALANAWAQLENADAEATMPMEAFAEMAGFDLEHAREKYDWDPSPMTLDESDEQVQEQFDEMNNSDDDDSSEEEDSDE